MSARRLSGVIRLQPAISSPVRKQPMHSPLCRWITQIFTQGESISGRFQTSTITKMRQPVKRALQDVTRRDMVNHFRAPRTRCICL